MKHLQQAFSIVKEDLLFNFSDTFEGVFRFSAYQDEEPSHEDDVRQVKNTGYDFQNECTPFVEIHPFPKEAIQKTGISINDMVITILIEDPALKIRREIYSIEAKNIKKPTKKEIDLKSCDDLSLHHGFEIRCYISRKDTIEEDKNIVWNKSQVIYHSIFVVKPTLDEALFEIAWTDFSDEQESQELLYFVDWKNSDVSHVPDVHCFQVKANNKLKAQFKRLEHNKHFGGFCIRMIAEAILKELLLQTLRFASIDEDVEPDADSLHDKFARLLEKINADFDDLARKIQSSDPAEQMSGAREVTKILQRRNQIGSALEVIKFGGYRQ